MGLWKTAKAVSGVSPPSHSVEVGGVKVPVLTPNWRPRREGSRAAGKYTRDRARALAPWVAARQAHLEEDLEAGGVEPPSEKPCHPKTTCLSHSKGFAGGAQNGQDAPPTSPMISPPRSGPKRNGQPTV